MLSGYEQDGCISGRPTSRYDVSRAEEESVRWISPCACAARGICAKKKAHGQYGFCRHQCVEARVKFGFGPDVRGAVLGSRAVRHSTICAMMCGWIKRTLSHDTPGLEPTRTRNDDDCENIFKHKERCAWTIVTNEMSHLQRMRNPTVDRVWIFIKSDNCPLTFIRFHLEWVSEQSKFAEECACCVHSACCLPKRCSQYHLRKIGGFELWEAQLDCQLMSPHNFTATASKRHELWLCSAQSNDLRKSCTLRKSSIIEE